MTITTSNKNADKYTAANSRLVFFDMDRTILDISPYHKKNFLSVLNKIFGVPELIPTEIAGLPYMEVVRRYAAASGISNATFNARMEMVEEHLVENMLAILPEDLHSFVLPGASEILEKLSREQIPLGLTTGTIRALGVPILKRSGLLKYFPITVFGDSFSKREEIVNKGLEEATWVYGLSRDKINLVTIGDAPSDILAGKAYMAYTISVCTGLHTANQLKSYQPDFIIPDLSDTESLFQSIVMS